MKRLLLFAALAAALSLPLAKPAAAVEPTCYEESYGGYQCGTTCVHYNDEGSVTYWITILHMC